MKPFKTEIDAERDLLCRWEGCRNRWTVDFSHGRLCSHHDAIAARGGPAKSQDNPVRHQAPIPLREAVRPFSEPAEHDDPYVHDEVDF